MSLWKVFEAIEQKMTQRENKPLIYKFFCLNCYEYSTVFKGKTMVCEHCGKVRTY